MDKRAFLASLPLFEPLGPSVLETLARRTTEHDLERGDVLFLEGTPAQAFFALQRGLLKLTMLSAEGTERILHIVDEGELVAEAAILAEGDYPASCEALEPSVVLVIPAEVFLGLLRGDPNLTLRLLAAYSQRMRFLVRKIEELSLLDVRQRLLGYLEHHAKEEQGRLVCTIPYNKKDLAALLGTIPETLSRALSTLRKQGMITTHGSQVVVVGGTRALQGED